MNHLKAGASSLAVAAVVFVLLASLWFVRRMVGTVVRFVELGAIVILSLLAAYVIYEISTGWASYTSFQKYDETRSMTR